MLKIIQHQQKLPVPESIGHGVNGPLPRFGNAEDLPHGGQDTAWLADRRKVDHRDLVEAAVETGGHQNRQPRLADSGGPAECHQPDALAQKQGPNGSGFLHAAHHSGEICRSPAYPHGAPAAAPMDRTCPEPPC